MESTKSELKTLCGEAAKEYQKKVDESIKALNEKLEQLPDILEEIFCEKLKRDKGKGWKNFFATWDDLRKRQVNYKDLEELSYIIKDFDLHDHFDKAAAQVTKDCGYFCFYDRCVLRDEDVAKDKTERSDFQWCWRLAINRLRAKSLCVKEAKI